MRYFAFGHLCLVEQEVDDFIFIKRSAQLSGSHWLALNILHELFAIFRAILLCSLLHQHAHFLRGNLNFVRLADFRKEQTQTHPALGDLAIVVLLGFDFLQRRSGIFFLLSFLQKLRPDLFELGVDHAFRHFEIMTSSQRIEKLALHLRAGKVDGLLLQLAAHQFLELVEAVEAEILSELVINLGLCFDLHLFYSDVELGILACQIFGLILFRESDCDGFLVTGLHANQLLFKAGDELARANHQSRIFRLAAFKFDTVELANKIDDQLITFCRLLALRSILVALVLACDAGNGFINRFIGNRNNQTLKLQAIG